MKKLIKNYAVFAALVFALVVGMASCKNNSSSSSSSDTDSSYHELRIDSMAFAYSETDYSKNVYITSVNREASFYLGFNLYDSNKDIDKIYLNVKNELGITIVNGDRELIVPTMSNYYEKCGTNYKISDAGTYTFSAYAVDSAGNKSKTLTKTLIVNNKITIIDENKSIPASSYYSWSFTLNQAANLEARVEVKDYYDKVYVYLFNSENFEKFKNGTSGVQYYVALSNDDGVNSFSKSANFDAGTYYFVVQNKHLLYSKDITVSLVVE